MGVKSLISTDSLLVGKHQTPTSLNSLQGDNQKLHSQLSGGGKRKGLILAERAQAGTKARPLSKI